MTSLAVQTNVNTNFFFFVELLHPTGSGEDGKTQAEKKVRRMVFWKVKKRWHARR